MTDGPREIDFSKPSAARLYDLFLGGEHNYPVDRQFAAEILDICPFVSVAARHNRGFLRRAVEYMANAGVRQFLDVGSGVPTVDNVHQVARRLDPSCRVVYVDNDLDAVLASREKLVGAAGVRAVYGDLRHPDGILAAEEIPETIDFSQPIGLLMVAVLHFVRDDDGPHELVRRYLDALPSGSMFAATHVTVDEMRPGPRSQMEEVERRYGSTANPATVRTRTEFERFFVGLDLADPGVAFACDWRATEPVPDDDPARPSVWAALGHKP